MPKFFVWFLGLAVLSGVLLHAEVRVTDLTVSTRYPWNGLVDITYSVEGDDAEADVYVSFTGWNGDRNCAVTMTRLTGPGVSTPVRAGGPYTVTWDAAAESPGFHSSDFTVKAVARTTSPSLVELVVTTAEDVVDENDGVLSFGEAVAQANEIGDARITFNIPETDILTIERNVYLESGVTVSGINQATGNCIISNQHGFELHIASGSKVENFHIKNTSSSYYSPIRNGGDIKLEGGIAENLHASENGDIHLWNNSDSKVINTFVEAGGQLNVEDHATAETVTVYHNGFLTYTDATFGGKIIIGGVILAREIDFNNAFSLLAEGSEVELNLTEWTPNEIIHIAYLPMKSSSYDVYDRDCSKLIENYRHFSGAASYTVRVKPDQELGIYLLMGNAGDFTNSVNLAVGGETFTDALEIGREYANGGRSYTLSINDDNVLQLTIAESQATYLVVDLSGGPEAESYPYRYSAAGPDLSDDTCRTTELWLRHIPAGTFMMGSPEDELGRDDDETQHQVTLTKDFYIGVFECTQKQYELVMGSNPSQYKSDTRPVESVSYQNDLRGVSPSGQVVEEDSFFGKLKLKTGLNFDLPTEAQWEYACRAGTTTSLNSGKNIANIHTDAFADEICRYLGNRSDGTGGYTYAHTTVGMYPPNAWGLYDMHGNVGEYSRDWYGSFEATPAVDPTGPSSGTRIIEKGGSWEGDAQAIRSAFRESQNLVYGARNFGFRIACFPYENKPQYVIVDLSGGIDATTYPVRYSTEGPDLSDDTCRTTELWLRRIPAGTFTMGSPENELGRSDDETQHQVTLTQDYYIGVFECTQKQWELVMGSNPSYYSGDTRPVEWISYSTIRGALGPNNTVTASSFLGKLQAKTGLIFDLPTEAQWEYACRAGTTTALNSGYNLSDAEQCPNLAELGRYYHNQSDGKGGFTQAHTAVGSYLPNAWGLYDMHGNVCEWCLDWYDEYSTELAIDPHGPDTGSRIILRGGSWYLSEGAQSCRSGYRLDIHSTHYNLDDGFRIVYLP